ncbi:hypothetical protein P152DRAFT_472145 [Eremomyces bilateralis CBS 781.70]|uniref:Ubiquitin-like domain-containing protein n=1 Tax=Eremomyces bilateralis CBS 781.70 TaxID=1392243 RepID=A0A6G1G8L8_9PEZI|nr:uncharacterized protein P152DRAFT_472145 [Eremomyces bilateralis CBS 781.70]KAF1814373.1 hypothetical protein P152DRAFT_472145 [Eremomyces bilateralis CBS 781.70]
MPLTRRYLESEREAFFDTQVGGDVNAWSALRSACDVIRSGGESNLATATAILRASGLSCPSGRLWVEGKDIADQEARRAGLLPRRTRTQLRGGVWDERGNHYFVPAWVVTDPLGVVEGQGGSRMSAALVAVAGNGHAHDGHNSDAKGKAKAPEEPEVPEEHIVRVPVRVATAARDITCRIRRDDNVEVLVRRIRHKCQLEGDAKIRVVLMGKVLLNNLSLPSQGWSEGLVVQAFV